MGGGTCGSDSAPASPKRDDKDPAAKLEAAEEAAAEAAGETNPKTTAETSLESKPEANPEANPDSPDKSQPDSPDKSPPGSPDKNQPAETLEIPEKLPKNFVRPKTIGYNPAQETWIVPQRFNGLKIRLNFRKDGTLNIKKPLRWTWHNVRMNGEVMGKKAGKGETYHIYDWERPRILGPKKFIREALKGSESAKAKLPVPVVCCCQDLFENSMEDDVSDWVEECDVQIKSGIVYMRLVMLCGVSLRLCVRHDIRKVKQPKEEIDAGSPEKKQSNSELPSGSQTGSTESATDSAWSETSEALTQTKNDESGSPKKDPARSPGSAGSSPGSPFSPASRVSSPDEKIRERREKEAKQYYNKDADAFIVNAASQAKSDDEKEKAKNGKGSSSSNSDNADGTKKKKNLESNRKTLKSKLKEAFEAEPDGLIWCSVDTEGEVHVYQPSLFFIGLSKVLGVTNFLSADPHIYAGEKEVPCSTDNSVVRCIAHIAACIAADVASKAKNGMAGWFGMGGDDKGKKK